MRCDSCGHENPPGASFCADCGTPLGAATRRTASKRGFRKALAWTAVPITALSTTSTAGGTFLDGFELVWFVAAMCWIVAVGVAVGLKVAGKSQIAYGVLAGAGVGFLALAVTCFWQPLWLLRQARVQPGADSSQSDWYISPTSLRLSGDKRLF